MYYLVSIEYDEFSEPRKILSFEEVQIDNRQAFLVTVNKPVFGQNYGLGNTEIVKLYLLGKYEEITVPFSKQLFPIEVHVLIPKYVENELKINSLEQLQNIAWCDIIVDNKEL